VSARELGFKGRLGGMDFDDPAAFDKALKIQRPSPRRIGSEVAFYVGRTWVTGQIWDRAPGRSNWWVRGNDGHTYRANGGHGHRVNSLGQQVAS